MKNIEMILKDRGIEIPEDVKADVLKEVAENYKTIAEFEKVTGKLSTADTQVKEMTEALKKFEGLDPDAVKQQVSELQDKLTAQREEFAKQIAERDQNDAFERELGEYEFTSRAARASIAEKVKSANLTFKDGKHLGFADLMEQIKTEDADAFKPTTGTVAKFTEKGTGKNSGTLMTRDQIFEIKDTAERQAAIKANPQLFE